MVLNEFTSIDQRCSENGISNNLTRSTENENTGLIEVDQIPFDQINGAANFLLNSTKYRPKIGVICGSGLDGIAENIKNADIIPYKSIPNFPVSTVEGHRGQMIFGTINDVPVMCMQGRFHYLEGYSMAKCCMSIRVMKVIGVTHLIVTNAAGSLNDAYNVGDIMILRDHINFLGLSGVSPLRGPNENRFGPRFLSTSKSYDKTMISHALDIASELKIRNSVHEGVYVCVGGPTYESIAEVRMLTAFGGDSVGMSTVHEVITAKHSGIKVIAFSFITNKCVADYSCEEEPNHVEIITSAKKQQLILAELIHRLITRIEID